MDNKDDKVKSLYFGNLNITFGFDNLPLLECFESIFYPVINSKIKKYAKKQGIEDSDNFYQITDVKLEVIDEEYVLVGVFEHSVKYERDKYRDEKSGKVVEEYGELKGVYISKFYLFLKNHRIALIKEESKSPSLVNLKSYLKYILDFNRDEIKKETGEKIPYAVVDILNIPLDTSIEEEIKKFSHISKVRLKFLTLNGKIDRKGLLDDIDESKKASKAKHVYLVYVSPKNESEIIETVKVSKSNVEKRIEGKDLNGKPKILKDNDFETREFIELDKENITEEKNESVIKKLKKYSEILISDEENDNLYYRFNEKLKNIFNDNLKR